MDENKIKRINELYHKSKAVGLTEDEKDEQQRLRKEYIEAIRGNMRATLDNTSIQNEDGTLTPLKIVRQNNLAKMGKLVDNREHDDIPDEDKVMDIEELRKQKLAERKKQLRKKLNELRSELKEREVRQRSGIICNHIICSDQFKNNDNICVYSSFRNEVSCEDIIEKAYKDGKHVFVPVVNTIEKTMDFVEINKDTEWTEDEYGIREPVINDNSLKFYPLDKALIIMPGLGFDKNKNRIGYGGGYYDRYLSGNNEYITMAACYSFQIINEELPYDENDVKPQYIVTEDGII